MAYHLVNRYGNVHKMVETERERDELIKSGFKPFEEKAITNSGNLEKMTVEQLEAFAKENNIDLTGCGNKAEKLSKIKAGMNM